MKKEIVESKEGEIQEKSDKLFEKTEKIKKYATGANVYMFGMAKELSEIKSEKLYEYWDTSENVTWVEYVSNSEVPVSVDVADKWIRVYENYVENLGYDVKELADIDYSKLLLILPKVKDNPQSCEELLPKAKTLSYSDLKDEVKGECEHKHLQKEVIWRCKDCNKVIKKRVSEPQEDFEEEL